MGLRLFFYKNHAPVQRFSFQCFVIRYRLFFPVADGGYLVDLLVGLLFGAIFNAFVDLGVYQSDGAAKAKRDQHIQKMHGC